MSKTIEQKSNFAGFPKAREVIELTGIGTGQLTLHDRRLLNLLYEQAHNTHGMTSDKEFEIALKDIRGSHKGGERVRDSLHRLMSVVVDINTTVNGVEKIVKTHLFDFTESDLNEDDPTAIVRFGLPRKLQAVLKDSNQWGRIKAEVVMAMSSKYAIALYELLQLRSGLKVWQEEFELQKFRQLLGVPEKKLTRTPDFIRRVLTPAELEVNGLSDYGVKLQPLRMGGSERGKLIGVKMSWWQKSPDEFRESQKEIKRSKVGRLARLRGDAENIA